MSVSLRLSFVSFLSNIHRLSVIGPASVICRLTVIYLKFVMHRKSEYIFMGKMQVPVEYEHEYRALLKDEYKYFMYGIVILMNF